MCYIVILFKTFTTCPEEDYSAVHRSVNVVSRICNDSVSKKSHSQFYPFPVMSELDIVIIGDPARKRMIALWNLKSGEVPYMVLTNEMYVEVIGVTSKTLKANYQKTLSFLFHSAKQMACLRESACSV